MFPVDHGTLLREPTDYITQLTARYKANLLHAARQWRPFCISAQVWKEPPLSLTVYRDMIPFETHSPATAASTTGHSKGEVWIACTANGAFLAWFSWLCC